jgi:hypothetical protein
MVARGLHDLLHALLLPMLPGLMRRHGRAGLRRLDGAAVVEVDVGDDRHIHLAHDLMQRGGRFLR